MLYEITIDGKNYRLELDRADGRWSCRLDGRDLQVDAVLVRHNVLSLRIGNLAYEIKSSGSGTICICGLAARVSPRKSAIPALCAAVAAPGTITALGKLSPRCP